MSETAALVSLATSVPPYLFHQNQILEAARRSWPTAIRSSKRFRACLPTPASAIATRVKPMEWYLEPRGWPERTRPFSKARKPCLSMSRARRSRAPICGRRHRHGRHGMFDRHRDADAGGAGRGAAGFRADVSRVPVFGLGCAGGVSGLSIASRLAQARPGTNVLLVALELCTLAVRHDELTKANIVAASLFGDGAAAVVLRAGDGGATRIEAAGEKLWPDTLDIMGWSVDPEGFGVIFQRTIPDFVRETCRPGGRPKSCRGWACRRTNRSLRLPSRRRQGDHGTRARAVARPGHARS